MIDFFELHASFLIIKVEVSNKFFTLSLFYIERRQQPHYHDKHKKIGLVINYYNNNNNYYYY